MTEYKPIAGGQVFRWHRFELELDSADSQILISVREYLDGICEAQVQSAEEAFHEVEAEGVDPIEALNNVLAKIEAMNG